MSRMGRLGEARTQLGRALRLARDLDDAAGQGQSHFQLALICGSENDYRRAIAHCGLASRLAGACRCVADEATFSRPAEQVLHLLDDPLDRVESAIA
jgi:hypothetical protein